MKKTLDKLLLCDLYQISENQGYIDKAEIHGKNPIGYELYCNSFVNKICSVIVKKNGFSKYNLKEILTGIPINTIYEALDEYSSCDWYNHTARGIKSEYDTFILVPSIKKEITVEKLEKYINDHKDVQNFKMDLEELLKNGFNSHVNKKLVEIKKVKENDAKVKKLLKIPKENR